MPDDNTTPSPTTTTTPTTSSLTRYVYTPTFRGNSMLIDNRGPDQTLEIEVRRGADVTVQINDAEAHFVYGSELLSSGAARPWDRVGASSMRTFYAVTQDIDNVTFAADQANTNKKPKYGPVIKIKPVG